MKTLIFIATAVMIAAPAFAAPISKDAVIIKLPRIEVIGKRPHALNKSPTKMAASATLLPKNALIKLPRIEVIAKRNCRPVLPSMLLAAEQGDGIFLNVVSPTMSLAKKTNFFMPYGV
jgi:hypothetical protein